MHGLVIIAVDLLQHGEHGEAVASTLHLLVVPVGLAKEVPAEEHLAQRGLIQLNATAAIGDLDGLVIRHRQSYPRYRNR